MSGADARAKFDAGASLVQVLSGLVFRGPGLIAECVEGARQAALAHEARKSRPH
jgi:dihydroorotate dehydrogenase